MTTSAISTRDLVDAEAILVEFFGETEGEVTPELGELETWLGERRDEKFERWGLWLVGEEREVAKIDAEIARLKKRKAAWEKRIEHSKDRLRFYMARFGVEQVKGALLTVARRFNPPAVKGELTVEQLKALHATHPAFVRYTPEHMIPVPESYSLDKKAITDAWKAAGTVVVGKKKTIDEDKARAAVPPGLDVTRAEKLELK